MNNKKPLTVIFIFAIIGVLFAGYLTFTKFVLGYCPLKEPCPYFLGYPACVYGLFLFGILLLISALMLFNQKLNSIRALDKTLFWVSLVGIVFALYSTYQELVYVCPVGKCSYSLLLPTCIYGLAMYIVIFVFSNKLK